MATAPVVFTRRLDHLPDRLRQVVENARAGTFVLALKTAFKPNATIPLIWLVLTTEALLLCNTHSTRGLWGRHARGSLPSLRLKYTSAKQPYLEMETSEGARTLTLPNAVTVEHIDQFFADYKRIGGAQ